MSDFEEEATTDKPKKKKEEERKKKEENYTDNCRKGTVFGFNHFILPEKTALTALKLQA